MDSLTLISLFVAAICAGMPNYVDAQNETRQEISLLETVNKTSEAVASILPNVATLLKNQKTNHNQTTVRLSQLENSQIQMSSTLSQVVHTLSQVVLMLQGKMHLL